MQHWRRRRDVDDGTWSLSAFQEFTCRADGIRRGEEAWFARAARVGLRPDVGCAQGLWRCVCRVPHATRTSGEWACEGAGYCDTVDGRWQDTCLSCQGDPAGVVPCLERHPPEA